MIIHCQEKTISLVTVQEITLKSFMLGVTTEPARYLFPGILH